MFCKEKLSELVGDKIHDLRRTNSKEAVKLSVSMFFLEEINRESLKPVLNILNRHSNCKHTKRVFNYLDDFNLREIPPLNLKRRP